MTSTRFTDFLTVPFATLSVVAFLRFREPGLHRAGEPAALRQHVAATFRILTQQQRLLPVIALAVLSSLLLQSIFEFGPLWLVAAMPVIMYGPYWAGLMATLGLGGLLAGRLRLDRPAPWPPRSVSCCWPAWR
jgi:hypothetical protein